MVLTGAVMVVMTGFAAVLVRALESGSKFLLAVNAVLRLLVMENESHLREEIDGKDPGMRQAPHNCR